MMRTCLGGALVGVKVHHSTASTKTSGAIKSYACRITNVCCDAALTLAFATIGRVAMVTRHAGLAVRTGGEVTALLTNAAVNARAVAVTLACCKKRQKSSFCCFLKARKMKNYKKFINLTTQANILGFISFLCHM